MKLCHACLLGEHDRHDGADGWCECRRHLAWSWAQVVRVIAVRPQQQ